MLLASRGQPDGFARVAQYLVPLGAAKVADLQGKGSLRAIKVNQSYSLPLNLPFCCRMHKWSSFSASQMEFLLASFHYFRKMYSQTQALWFFKPRLATKHLQFVGLYLKA